MELLAESHVCVEVFPASVGLTTLKNENDCELVPRDAGSTWVGPACRGVAGAARGPEPAMHPEEPR